MCLQKMKIDLENHAGLVKVKVAYCSHSSLLVISNVQYAILYWGLDRLDGGGGWVGWGVTRMSYFALLRTVELLWRLVCTVYYNNAGAERGKKG